MSDGWGAYQGVNQIGGGIYEHQVVIHAENFVDPQHPDIHTQRIEGIWMHAKRKIREQLGTSEGLFTSYLHEFIWRNLFREVDKFSAFVICIRDQYPL